MSVKTIHVLAALAAVAAFVVSNEARADDSSPVDPFDPYDPGYEPPIYTDEIDMRLKAFQYMIRSCENRDSRYTDDDRYQMFYGNTRFLNLDDHPVITGEKKGVPLPAAMCRAAGFSAGCVSTAAGAYQIIKPTWQRARKAGLWGAELPDFSRESQDEACRRLLIECGALPLIEAGDFAGAVRKASKLWASLPGSTAGQGAVSIAVAESYFNQYLWG